MESVNRLLDANRNRAGEALRTAEDYARFVTENTVVAGRLKALRHDLADAVRLLETGESLRAHRDTAGDVGVPLKTGAEASRPDMHAVAAAAFRRAAEALRVLGEAAKTVSGDAAARFEKIRYALYDIEPVALAAGERRARLRAARLYVLVTASLCSTDPVTACREAVAGGADIIQMREKEMEDGAFLALAERLRDVCRAGGALFFVNDRTHIAAIVDADGAHLGQGDLPTCAARRIVGPDRILGRSTSAPEFAERAAADGADYIGVGPVFETKTKEHRRAAGLEYVNWASSWDGLPWFAIGGVGRGTIDAVLDAGARAVAICTAVTMAKDIAAEAAFVKAMISHKGDVR